MINLRTPDVMRGFNDRPYGVSSAPLIYKNLAITGSATMQNTARLQADLGGNTPQTSDRLTVGSLQLGSIANTLVLDLRFSNTLARLL